jgi:hypothetical protein
MWLGISVLLAQILGIVLAAPRHSSDPVRVMLAAGIGALGTLVLALILAPLSRVPRAAYWATAAIYSGFILVSPALSPTPQSWVEFMRPQLWYLPWFFFMVVSESPRPRATGVCATVADRSGIMLIGVALFFLGIVTFAIRISAGRH